RIPEDRAIVVNYGLPNDGADRIANRLAGMDALAPLGINIVNTNRGPGSQPESDTAIVGDYVRSLERLRHLGDYYSLNLSCPNTPEGRGFVSDSCRLSGLLDAIRGLGLAKPVLLKIAPFPGVRELEGFLAAADQAPFISGFTVNLAPGKPPGLTTPAERLKNMPGAVSGKPSEEPSNRTIVELYRRMDRRRYHIIGTGGVFTAKDAYRKIRLGASLVQLLTALIYEG